MSAQARCGWRCTMLLALLCLSAGCALDPQHARRGVKVRVIADQLFSLEDTHLLAALARAHANFELRLYNPAFHKASRQSLEFAAGMLCCFLRFNQRMHDKMLLVDDAIGIVGG